MSRKEVKPFDENAHVRKVSFFAETMKSLRKNRMAMVGLVVLAILVFACIFAPYLSPYEPDGQMVREKFIAPNAQHWFGTDNLGRDILTRILYGGRISLIIGLIAAVMSALMGTILGSIAGFYGGKIDNIVMRIVDVMMAIPSMLLSIALVAALGNKVQNVILAVAIASAPSCSRIVRASVMSVKGQEYVEAATSIGASNFRIILKHVLPNCLAPLIVNTTMSVANAILTAASLSFVGLGVQPPSPEWGAMLSAARPFIRDYSYTVFFPGLAIMVTILSLNLVRDGLRDALDPKLKR